MTEAQLAALAALAGRALTEAEIEALGPLVAARADDQIAALLSVGRTRSAPTEAGNGTVLEVLGLEVGNPLLDVLLSSNPASPYRHVRPLLEQGRLRLDLAPAQMALGSLIGQDLAGSGVTLTQAHVAALIARTRVPDPVSERAVTLALNGA
jgi:hypothetical protein